MDSIHRENFLKELAAGFDAYNELVKNLQEGIKFYKNLTQVYHRFHKAIYLLIQGSKGYSYEFYHV